MKTVRLRSDLIESWLTTGATVNFYMKSGIKLGSKLKNATFYKNERVLVLEFSEDEIYEDIILEAIKL